MQNYKTLSLVLGAALLVITTAGASVYMVKQQPSTAQKVMHRTQAQRVAAAPPAQPDLPLCDDGNIAGKAVGGVGGGVLGSMVGKGNGKTAATIGGTLGGAYVGGQVVPLKNVTCR